MKNYIFNKKTVLLTIGICSLACFPLLSSQQTKAQEYTGCVYAKRQSQSETYKIVNYYSCSEWSKYAWTENETKTEYRGWIRDGKFNP